MKSKEIGHQGDILTPDILTPEPLPNQLAMLPYLPYDADKRIK